MADQSLLSQRAWPPDAALMATEGAHLAAILSKATTNAVDILQAVVRMSPLAMVLTDPHATDFPVVFCNSAFTRLTGYAEHEILGRNCRFLQGPDTDPAARKLMREAILAGGEAQLELWNYRKDGSRFWNSMFMGPVTDADGKLLYYFGSQTDSSSRREAEEARKRTQRMDTLGSIAAGVAHEINNLMTVVVGNVEALCPVGEPGKPEERLERIQWAASATAKLTRQMLSFAGRQDFQIEVVDLNAILRGLDQLLGQVAASTSAVLLKLDPTPLLAKVDVGQLELALINLVRNASDASPAGSSIVLSTTSLAENGADWVEIAITDHGSGMSSAVAAKAADPFFTTKNHGKGTGLGLSMVAGFCRDAGGHMSIVTAPAQGTTIQMTFPRAVSMNHLL